MFLRRWNTRSTTPGHSPRRQGPRPRRLSLEALEDRTLLTTWFVWQFGGSDQFGNGTPNAPFQSIQQAINQAAAVGDTIKVAGGVYTYDPFNDLVAQGFGVTGVIQVVNKHLTILGGFNPADGWVASHPGTNPSVIDGQGSRRGVLMTTTSFGNVTLVMDGFTIQNCVGGIIPARGGTFLTDAHGGGMLSEQGKLTLSNLIFKNNVAQAANTANPTGGIAAGGGIGVFSPSAPVTLTNVSFVGNQALGGSGAQAGGFGQGGGLFTAGADIVANNVTFTNNIARGGSTNGGGIANGLTSDALGGAANVENVPNSAVFTNAVVTGNQSIGGNSATGLGGGGQGGGFLAENSAALIVNNSRFQNNQALGGNGPVANPGGLGGIAIGGAIDATGANIAANQTFFLANTAQGGNSTSFKPSPQGGAIASITLAGQAPHTVNLFDCVIAGNNANFGQGAGEQSGGGGGGISLAGANASIVQCTIADNNLGNVVQNLQGQGILAFAPTGVPTTANISYSIIADHANSFRAAAVQVFPGATANFNRNLFAANTNDLASSGTVNGHASDLQAASAGFVSPGNYQITSSSPAAGQAAGSTATVDITGQPRPSPPSIGAYEVLVPLIQFAAGSYSVRQDAGSVTVTVLRSGDLSGQQTVTYTVGDITAVNGTNFASPAQGTRVFNPGDTSQSIGIPILNQSPNIGPKTFSVNLAAVQGSGNPRFGQVQNALVTIVSSLTQTIGTFDTGSGTWYLRLTNGPGSPDIGPFAYGAPGWRGVVGDWDGNGTATVGVVNPGTATWFLRNENSPGNPDAGVFIYGAPGWMPVSGDWNGLGRSGIGTYDAATGTWYLRNSTSGGAPNVGVFQFGLPGWLPVVGDWDGNGTDGIGVFDPSTGTWYLRNEASPGAPDAGVFRYGAPGWTPVTGDWAGTGAARIGVVDPTSGTWYLRFSLSSGAPDIPPFAYGAPGWQPVAGSWNGVGGAPELAGPGGTADPAPAALTPQQLDAAVSAALARLQAAGLSPSTLARLGSVRYQVGQLPGALLGLYSGGTVTMDATAAGLGWFIDPTPAQDEEFAGGAPLLAPAGSPAAGKIDLLTAVLHEMGHAAGLGDVAASATSPDLMADLLAAGVRRTRALDTIFAQASLA